MWMVERSGLRLVTNLPDVADWSSESLPVEKNGGEAVVRLSPGEHELEVRDSRDGSVLRVTLQVELR